jgi:glycosyltransferase involved in cell wall biosynthesis
MPKSLPCPVTTTVTFATRQRDQAGTGVTVIVSSYNYERYILDTLASVSAQTHGNLELIIVDDYSLDRSVEIVERWLGTTEARFSSAKLILHHRNHGLHQARNTAFENASNEFIFVLDSDNLLYPTAIAKLLEGCENAAAQMAYSQLEFFDEVTDIGGAGIWDPDRLAEGNYIDAMALVRKSAWHAVGGYSRLVNPGFEDYDLWCKFVEHGFKGVFIPEILCRYRIHGKSMLRRMDHQELEDRYFEMRSRHPWLK